MYDIRKIDTDSIVSILEATRIVALIIRHSQGLVDGIPNDRLRHLGKALIHAGDGDLKKTKREIKAAILAE